MTLSQARLLVELMRNEEFAGILAEIQGSEMETWTGTLRSAVRAGHHHDAALAEGRIAAAEALADTFKRMADRHRAAAPDRS